MVFDILSTRGFIKQTTDEDSIRSALSERSLTCYIGFDPTADSLHVGSLIPIMSLVHLQNAGHRPIVVVGGGTALIGDPSGKTEMRKMLTRETIAENMAKIQQQIARYISFDDDRALMLNNAGWLADLDYIDFLRDIGRHFRVNEMIKAEGYRQRLEREVGLSFVEFNYQLLQAYDFLVLNRKYQCELQLGGDDQWGNILAGVDLTRRVARHTVFGLTFPLITTASGAKMGKTAQGAVWLNANRTLPYDFYQYWRNTEDADVGRFLKYFTLLPLEEIEALEKLEGQAINEAKEVLAFEATRLCHGTRAAEEARQAARALFGGNKDQIASAPTAPLPMAELQAGIPIVELLAKTALVTSKSDAMRQIRQGAVSINGKKIPSTDVVVTEAFVRDGRVLVRKGKKSYFILSMVEF
ncbi:MAG: tyrosyl-tRNA synthetase [Candidatus Kentron sp. G]|nr:MAG: tyrosyl-tRNA synthetase [Candidatus Kentron sp. G]VFN04850.1 MAG: tyrosyl-tRNA synthetase [Candidatus Kentron sp. G]VFN06096.1 MAG: tyrosyl-tRNA synthetase [Candidatus Kentron sp. G]